MDPEQKELSESEKIVTKQMFGSSNFKQAQLNTWAGGGDWYPNAGGIIKRLKRRGIIVETLSDEKQAEVYRLDFKMERARRYNALGIFSLVLGLPSLFALYSDRQVFMTGVGLTIIGLIVVPMFVIRIRALNRDLRAFISTITPSNSRE